MEPAVQQDSDAFSHHIKTDWNLAGNLGRRYAKVSGDYNPIHLSKWSAKLFGFKRPIIHGMWTKSYCLSKLQKVNPVIFNQGFVVDTTFKQPLYLPNQVQMMVPNSNSNLDCINGESHFKVVASDLVKGQQLQHLIGVIHSI